MKIQLTFLAALIVFTSCGKKKEDKKAGVSAKVRSTGLTSLGLTAVGLPLTNAMTLAGMTANSVNLEYYKVPIRRINLITGGNRGASGYTGTSPNFYTCDSAKTDDECLVDLSQAITVDNLLNGTSSGEMIVESDVSYEGAAIEFCKDGAGTSGGTYKIKVKGSVLLGATTYYTSAASGLSSALTAAEEAEITVACSGMSTYFAENVVLGPDRTVPLVIYADPNGNVFATNYKTLANSNCLGEETLAVCAGIPSIFITVDTATPTVERYKLSVTTAAAGGAYRNLMVKMLFNSADAPIGATIQEYYLNDNAEKSLHTAFMSLGSVTTNADKTFSFGYSGSEMIKNFKRGTDTGNQVLTVVDAPLTFNQVKL